MSDDLWLFKSYADEDDVAAMTEVVERGTWWTKGDEVSEFERRIADKSDCEYGISFNSGTTALYAALVAFDVSGGEVIVPSFTFPATANAVVAAGAEPVFADIERDSLTLDPAAVRNALTPDTEAIVPIHFAGDICANIKELQAIAADHDVVLLEDAAHSLGATLDNRPVGSFGDAAMFSFCFNKVLTTGEGGMIVTDSPDVKRDLELFRSHGRNEDKTYVDYGHNFRMSSIAAALGISQAQKLDEMIGRRREMAAYLNDRLRNVDHIQIPEFPDHRNSVYQLYNIQFDDAAIQAPLQEYLSDAGIPTRVTYDPVHLTQYYRQEWGWDNGDLPVTEDVSTKILTLPFHLYLDDRDLERIAETVIEFVDDEW